MTSNQFSLSSINGVKYFPVLHALHWSLIIYNYCCLVIDHLRMSSLESER